MPYEEWKDTLDTLHMWMQIVGKIKLKLDPFLNQWWEVAFYVNAQGITTGRIYFDAKTFEIEFNFIYHYISIKVSDGRKIIIPMKPCCVSKFYKEFTVALKSLGIDVEIYTMPVEFVNPIDFMKDNTHCSYDSKYVTRWWQIILQINLIFDRFRTPFRGKSSPVQFYWGFFDLNSSRFSGKKAQPPKMDGIMGKIMRYAENEENFAFGFWPGDEKFPFPAFYSYIYPPPKGLENINLKSEIAAFDKKLSEYILLYEDVIKSANPEKEIENFLQVTYIESAKLAGWDTEALKGESP